MEEVLEPSILKVASCSILAQLEKSQKELVQQVSLDIRPEESIALVGETGSGKTMTAQAIMGLLPENVKLCSGSIAFCGTAVRDERMLRSLLGREIVYIPQNGHEFLNPSRTVRKQMFDAIRKLKVPRKEREAFACEKLRQAGFSEPQRILGSYPFQLSGGMAQRVVVAIALCSEAKLLIADEPTNGLDADSKEQVLNLLNELFSQAGKLIITHDISVAKRCDRIHVLCQGKMMETGPAAEVIADPGHPYTKALISALVENGMQETPLLREEAGICPFYRRCQEAGDACKTGMTLHEGQSRKWWCSRK